MISWYMLLLIVLLIFCILRTVLNDYCDDTHLMYVSLLLFPPPGLGVVRGIEEDATIGFIITFYHQMFFYLVPQTAERLERNPERVHRSSFGQLHVLLLC